MWLIIILIIILFIYNQYMNNINNNKENNYDNYRSNGYVMTQTELKFYRELKKVTEKLNMSIFPQVNLQRIIDVKDKNISDRNRIKSRSIDFCIVNNENCKIICCIELDDYTHNSKKAQITDNFKNELFKKVNIPLHRIKVNNYYNVETLESIIKESIKPPTLIENS